MIKPRYNDFFLFFFFQLLIDYGYVYGYKLFSIKMMQATLLRRRK